MSSDKKNSNTTGLDLSSLGENLLETYITKGKDSIISKVNEDESNSMQNKDDFPTFFKMLDTDVSDCDEKWIEEFNQATNEASETELKQYAKPAIDMLTSIIYFLITESKSQKKTEKNDEKKKENHFSDDQDEQRFEPTRNFYYLNDDYDNSEILKELTDGLDPKYLDPDFNLIHSTRLQRNKFDDYTLYGDGSKIYKTQDDIH